MKGTVVLPTVLIAIYVLAQHSDLQCILEEDILC